MYEHVLVVYLDSMFLICVFFLLLLVSELASSLEESRDELQVVKRKNTALIKVSVSFSLWWGWYSLCLFMHCVVIYLSKKHSLKISFNLKTDDSWMY